jgi:hypothetical protein
VCYEREAATLDRIHDGSWGEMPALRNAFFAEGRGAMSQAWYDTPLDAWDHSVQQREQTLVRQALEIEERAVACLQAALTKIAPDAAPTRA